ncbi:hypothetical protein LPB136_08575 [Tenacibaculum todarodis]|uniref:Uncharacterized protein n=1 Tax=Tenacibaculum todarodis TaxID=1850252 RepID=A0A1L3JJX9_9FLAO|nr:hypothetical protein [Tenacibaculum todarodis]APG65404.1 hypothetical protein LPB136_08575 [Tenacibaculum todarodis]
MEDFKSKIKIPLSLKLDKIISKLLDKNEINKGYVLEVGSFISAHFIENLHQQNFKKGKGPLTKYQLEVIFENVGDFYLQNFKNQFTQSDAEVIMKRTMDIVMSENSEKIISDYFKKLNI